MTMQSTMYLVLCTCCVMLSMVQRTRSFSLQPPVLSPSVWTVFGELANKYQAINLGQGYPDWSPPAFVQESLRRVTDHQYTRPAGHPQLVDRLAARYSQHLQRKILPFSEVAITVGASQALYLSLITLLKPNDEVLMFDPFFELYQKQVALTGATTIFVPLGNSQLASKAEQVNPWALDVDQLERAITPKTKVLILNSPHNPTGKVFSRTELEQIAAVMRRHRHVTVISDEVYKYTIYDAQAPGDSSAVGHYHFAALPDMWDRTITISSCGKTFSVTGWQIGWMIAPNKFIEPVQRLLPCVQFCPPTPMQQALSNALVTADEHFEAYDNYYEWLRGQFANKRNLLEQGLSQVGIRSIRSEGGFFLMGELPDLPEAELKAVLAPQQQYVAGEPYDWKFCRYLTLKHGVAAIPASPFFSAPDYQQRYNLKALARFAFCKKDETLLDAKSRLARH